MMLMIHHCHKLFVTRSTGTGEGAKPEPQSGGWGGVLLGLYWTGLLCSTVFIFSYFFLFILGRAVD